MMTSSEFQREFEIFAENFIPFQYFPTLFWSFSTLFNLKWPCLTFSGLKWPQITVFFWTNRFLSVFPFRPISESIEIVLGSVFIDSRKKLVPKHSGFHGKKPTSGFQVPTGNGKVPYAIGQVELYTPPKFHANRSTRLGGDSLWHIKWTASNLLMIHGLFTSWFRGWLLLNAQTKKW